MINPTRKFCHRRGFTLLEMLITLSSMALILLAAQSAVLVAARAIPDGRSGASAVLLGSRAFDMLSADLSYANNIVSNSANDLSFKVAARDITGAPTIRYYLSGTKLMRQYNGGTAVSILDNVQEFQLVYDKRRITLPTTYTEGAEVVLSSVDVSNGLSDLVIDSTHSSGEYFMPTLPANATSYRVTKVRLYAKQGVAGGQTSVQLRNASGSLPTGPVLGSQTLSGASLTSTPSWQTFTYSGMPQTPAGSGMAVIAQFSSSTPSVNLQQASNTFSYASMFSSTDNGATWSTTSGKNFNYYVYGTVSVPDPIAYQYFLTGVRTTLRVGSDPAGRINAAVRVFNEPTVSGP